MKSVLGVGFVALLVLSVFVSAAQNWYYAVGDSQNDYQLTIEVKNGWNLLQGFHPSYISAGSQISASNVKAVFMYSPDKNKYFEIYPENKLPNSGLDQNDEYYDDGAGLYSYWVYIDNIQTCNDPACEVQGGKLNKLVYTIKFGEWAETPMKKGWNFVGINPDMYNGEYNPNQGNEGEYFSWDAIKGDCTYEKIYAWNPETQTWFTSMTSDLQIKSYDFDDFLGNGMLVKVSDACTLKRATTAGGTITPPPVIPN